MYVQIYFIYKCMCSSAEITLCYCYFVITSYSLVFEVELIVAKFWGIFFFVCLLLLLSLIGCISIKLL